MFSFSFVSLALCAVLASAQTPSEISPVLLEPGNNAGKCLTAASNSDGAAVTIQACTGASSQQWTFSGGSVKLFGNSKCLDVTNGSTKDGTKLQIWTCSTNGNPNQQFWYTGDKRLSWTNHGKCVDLTDGNQSNGNRIQVWSCGNGNANQVWNTGYLASALPSKSENGQTGTNACGTSSSQSSQCQTAWINGVDDFCLWAPPSVGTIGDTEREEVAWCTRSGRGTRVIPDGTLKGVHFVKTPDYVQVTGVGDFTKINVPRGDAGGELDPHGADGNGNPIGGLVFGNSFGNQLQYHEWTSFISDTEFCFRACVGPNAARNCQHIYDEMGCFWNMPANYDAGTFESCQGDDDLPMGVYGTSTWFQGVNPTPPAHPAAKSSNCARIPTVSAKPAQKKRDAFTTFYAPGPTPTA
ncbi:carbohydrate-binding module family 13 protein [Sistotremastrum niveocremeum HHB9708]|uniref:Carbohydrate-binding module family 13 protein n=1 Tax=Sistotremastrum niveocremeum HHB9708 TaxID=1314777 RepID=A0A164MVC4_9AGAM|nr:carbohydrate-binding module family 13 protein [Sistotremastrum niveocremeum HHB9708]